MEGTTAINDAIAVFCAQPDGDRLQTAANEGFKAVLNVRNPAEDGFDPQEENNAKAAGLDYDCVPFTPGQVDASQLDRMLARLDELPKPVLLHCKSGVRSSLVGLSYIATRENQSADDVFARGRQLGLPCDAPPPMMELIENYIRDRNG